MSPVHIAAGVIAKLGAELVADEYRHYTNFTLRVQALKRLRHGPVIF